MNYIRALNVCQAKHVMDGGASKHLSQAYGTRSALLFAC